jgi:signal transduction histidine kinase
MMLSQGEAGTLTLKETDVDLPALLRSVVDTQAGAAAKAGLSLECATPTGLPLLKADRIKLRQMLFNLIDNAIKFTPPGGLVSVTAALSRGAIAISVHDTGIGMRSEQIPLALAPFGRLAAPLTDPTAGAGLGLPICLRLAELHGAALIIDSAIGGGTTCTLAFPAARTLRQPHFAAA